MTEHDAPEPSTSAMALSLAEVQQRLPAGVTLDREIGAHVLRMKLKMIGPALAMLVGGAWTAYYVSFAFQASPWLMVPIGVATLYLVAGYLLGTRHVTIDGAEIAVSTRPLPLIGDGVVGRDKIERIEVTAVGRRSGALRFRVDAIRGARSIALVHDLVDEAQAFVVARYLAEQLSLPAPAPAKTP